MVDLRRSTETSIGALIQTMLAFMWQDDLVGVARFVNACVHNMNPSEGQASNQPAGVAKRDVM